MIKLELIASICKDFTYKRGIEVSKHAQILIKDILDAVILDPHPGWKVKADVLESNVNTFIRDLSKIYIE